MNYKIYKHFGQFLIIATCVASILYLMVNLPDDVDFFFSATSIERSYPGWFMLWYIINYLLSVISLPILGILTGAFFYKYGKNQEAQSGLIQTALVLIILASAIGIVDGSMFLYYFYTIKDFRAGVGMALGIKLYVIGLPGVIMYIIGILCIVVHKFRIFFSKSHTTA